MTDIHAFCVEQTRKGVSLKSALIEFELRRREVPFTRISKRLVTCQLGGRTVAFQLMNGPSSSVAIRTICDSKWTSRQLFADAGLSVTPSRAFSREAGAKALRFASETLGYPVVVKPNSSARGNGVTTGIQNDQQFNQAWQKALTLSKSPALLVERQVTGEDYRLFVADGKLISATWRKRASVEGDGRHTVLELIKRKNATRAQNVYLGNYPIPMEPDKLEALATSGHTLSSIPLAGEHVQLRNVSNLSSGGDSIDVTDRIHPSFKEMAIAAIGACPGMAYGGVDIIAQTIDSPATPENHVIGEIEFSPAPLAHFPAHGMPRNMAAAIVENYLIQPFPTS